MVLWRRHRGDSPRRQNRDTRTARRGCFLCPIIKSRPIPPLCSRAIHRAFLIKIVILDTGVLAGRPESLPPKPSTNCVMPFCCVLAAERNPYHRSPKGECHSGHRCTHRASRSPTTEAVNKACHSVLLCTRGRTESLPPKLKRVSFWIPKPSQFWLLGFFSSWLLTSTASPSSPPHPFPPPAFQIPSATPPSPAHQTSPPSPQKMKAT